MTNAKYWGAYLNRLMIADDADPIMEGDTPSVCLRKICNYVELLRANIEELSEGSYEVEIELDDDESEEDQ
jgi:hypothetical protein